MNGKTHLRRNYRNRTFSTYTYTEPEDMLPPAEKMPTAESVAAVREQLEADKELIFDIPESDLGPVSHVRLNIVPDGGISRLRLFGRIRR